MDGRVVVLASDGARDLEAIQVGQHQVEQEQVGWMGADQLEGARAIGAQAHVVASPRQVVPKRMQQALFVFDDEDIGHVWRNYRASARVRLAYAAGGHRDDRRPICPCCS